MGGVLTGGFNKGISKQIGKGKESQV